MSAWPQLSKPIYALDNFLMAKEASEATVNRPPAKPKGIPDYRSECDYLGNEPDPYPEDFDRS